MRTWQRYVIIETHSRLDIPNRLASREPSCAEVHGCRSRDDVGAVNHRVHVLAEGSDGGEDELEVGLELGLVVYEVH